MQLILYMCILLSNISYCSNIYIHININVCTLYVCVSLSSCVYVIFCKHYTYQSFVSFLYSKNIQIIFSYSHCKSLQFNKNILVKEDLVHATIVPRDEAIIILRCTVIIQLIVYRCCEQMNTFKLWIQLIFLLL